MTVDRFEFEMALTRPLQSTTQWGRGAQPQTARSVRLALDCLTPFTRQAIADAARLARQEGARIDCVFVEQTSLLRAAALPFTRELGLGIAARQLDLSQLERALHQQALETRKLLATVAAANGLSFSFEIARGSLIEEALRHADPHDLILAASSGYEPEPSASQSSRREQDTRKMLVLVDTLAPELPMLRVLLRAMPKASLSVWTTTQTDGEIEDQLRRLAAETGRPTSRLRPAASEPAQDLAEQLLSTLGALRPQLLAMQRERLASLVNELGGAMRRRASLLVGIPRSDNH